MWEIPICGIAAHPQYLEHGQLMVDPVEPQIWGAWMASDEETKILAASLEGSSAGLVSREMMFGTKVVVVLELMAWMLWSSPGWQPDQLLCCHSGLAKREDAARCHRLLLAPLASALVT